jgi:hypothetical protein
MSGLTIDRDVIRQPAGNLLKGEVQLLLGQLPNV